MVRPSDVRARTIEPMPTMHGNAREGFMDGWRLGVAGNLGGS